MPKSLSNRLDQLEKDIHVMLMLEDKPDTHCHHVFRGTSCCSPAGTYQDVSPRTQSLKSTKCARAKIKTPPPQKCRSISPPVRTKSHHCLQTRRRQSAPCRACPPSRSPSPSSIDAVITNYLQTIKENLRKDTKAIASRARMSRTPVPSSESCTCKSNDNIHFVDVAPTISCAEQFQEIKINPSQHSPKQKKCLCFQPATIDVTSYMELEEEKLKREKAEEMVKELQNEIDQTKVQISDMAQSKRMALEMTKQLKEKYENQRLSRNEVTEKLEKLQQENRELCEKLAEQVNLNETYIANTHSKIKSYKETIEEKVSEMQSKSKKEALLASESGQKLVSALKDRDDHIQRLRATSERIGKCMCEREVENRKLAEENDQLKRTICGVENTNRRLLEVNESLSKNVKEQHDTLHSTHHEAEKLKREICCFKCEIVKTQKEAEKWKSKATTLSDQRQQQLQEKLRESRSSERKSNEETQELHARLKVLQDNHQHLRKKSDLELHKLMKQHQKLQTKYDEMVKKLQTYEEEDRKKCDAVDRELQKFNNLLCEKEKILLNEKNELNGLVTELSDVVKHHRTRITILSALNRKQEVIIQSQNDAITSKDEQIQLARNEALATIEKSRQLEKQVALLRKSVETFETLNDEMKPITSNGTPATKLEKEVELTREALGLEKDKVRIKEKIIEDQTHTINNLKKTISARTSNAQLANCETKAALEQIRRANEEVNRVATQLELERQEKEALLNDITKIQWRKEQLAKHVDELQATIKRFCTSSVTGNAGQQQKVIASLEYTITLQQREWDIQRQMLGMERDQAISAARFATQKLVETVNDFQKQLETQKKVQRMLTTMLQEKEALIKCRSTNTLEMERKFSKACKAACSHSSGASCNQKDVTEIYVSPSICRSNRIVTCLKTPSKTSRKGKQKIKVEFKNSAKSLCSCRSKSKRMSSADRKKLYCKLPPDKIDSLCSCKTLLKSANDVLCTTSSSEYSTVDGHVPTLLDEVEIQAIRDRYAIKGSDCDKMAIKDIDKKKEKQCKCDEY